jgi:hypothetical protein
MRSNNNNKLKAFVRFDGSGRIIPSSLNVQSIKPKVGNWRQINSKECCLDNECIQPIYGENWIIAEISVSPINVAITVDTAPWMSVQMELLDCETGLPIASFIYVKGDENSLVVSLAVWDATCNIRVRGYCGPDFYSDWVYEFPY